MSKLLRKFNKREKTLTLIVIFLVLVLVGTIFLKGDLLKGIINSDPNQTEPPQSRTINTSFYSGDCNINLPEEFNDSEEILEVHFIDVGQGDSILIRLPDGNDILIDAGSGTNASNAMKDEYADYIGSMNMNELDNMLITHPDSDHVNMADILLNNFDVENIYYNDMYEDTSNTYRNFVDLTESEDATLFPVDDDGEYYSLENAEYDYKLDIYAPGYERFSDRNSISLVCLLEYGELKILFMGDAHYETEDYFMERIDQDSLDIDILKVGHHGSNSSTSAEFLDFITPEYAIISVGETNPYNHPSPFVMNRLFNYGIATYRTNRHGNIVLYSDHDGNFAFLPEKNVPIENNTLERDEKRLIVEE